MRIAVLVFSLASSWAIARSASSTQAPADSAPSDPAQMDTVVVSGVQPGPGLWKVSKGDHVLWVLGTLAPLPKHFEWKAAEVEAAIRSSQEVLSSPQVKVDAKIGFFGQLALLPSLIGVRKNPDDKTLQEVVPPELYSRWRVLKEKYIGRSNKVESWRPIFAALDLYEAAIDKSDLTDSGLVQKTVKSLAKRAGVKLTPVQIDLVIEDPKVALKEFKSGGLDDLDCFRRTLDRIDTDLATMTLRANAWATADVDALRGLPYEDQMTACRKAVTDSDLARSRGASDIEARMESAWLDTAAKSLSNNQVTFAMLPIARLLADQSYLARLRERGYSIEAPESESQSGAGDPSSSAP
ncbi:MAG: TraB/GumN family protein [Dokdonella sp.]